MNPPTHQRTTPTPCSAHAPPQRPISTVNDALACLTAIISELIRLSSDDRISAAQLEVLRTRRRQLSAVIDSVTRFNQPHPSRSRPTRTSKKLTD